MANKDSKVYGKVEIGQYSATAYQALQVLECVSCGEQISAGDLFLRLGFAGGGARRLPHCQECAPFKQPTPAGETGGQ